MKKLSNHELKLALYHSLWRRYQAYRDDGGAPDVHRWIRYYFIQEDIRAIVDDFFRSVKLKLPRREKRHLTTVLMEEMSLLEKRHRTVPSFAQRVLYYYSKILSTFHRLRVMWVADDIFSRLNPGVDQSWIEMYRRSRQGIEILQFQERHPWSRPYFKWINSLPLINKEMRQGLVILLLQRERGPFVKLWLRLAGKKRYGGKMVTPEVRAMRKAIKRDLKKTKKQYSGKITPSSDDEGVSF